MDRLAAALALALQAGPDFAADLRGLAVDRLSEIADSFDVDVIEIIGHTDEQPITSRISNLDRRGVVGDTGTTAPSEACNGPTTLDLVSRALWPWLNFSLPIEDFVIFAFFRCLPRN